MASQGHNGLKSWGNIVIQNLYSWTHLKFNGMRKTLSTQYATMPLFSKMFFGCRYMKSLMSSSESVARDGQTDGRRYRPGTHEITTIPAVADGGREQRNFDLENYVFHQLNETFFLIKVQSNFDLLFSRFRNSLQPKLTLNWCNQYPCTTINYDYLILSCSRVTCRLADLR